MALGLRLSALRRSRAYYHGRTRLHECHTRRLQTSLKAGTIFERTLIPLTKWFRAMWLITQSKDSISTLSMARQLDLQWDSAWLLRQKLAAVMAEDEASRKLDGRVEMDGAVLGGERHEHEGESAAGAGRTRSLSSSRSQPRTRGDRSASCCTS